MADGRWPMARPSRGDRRDRLQVPDRHAVGSPAGAVRLAARRLQPAADVGHRRHVGTGLHRADGPGRCRREPQLGRLRGLHHRAPCACRECHPPWSEACIGTGGRRPRRSGRRSRVVGGPHVMMIDRAAATDLPDRDQRVRAAASPADERPGKDAEILALRHQITVFERQLDGARLRFTPSDRALLAALLHRMPLPTLRRLRLLVRPDTVMRWHRDLARHRHAALSRPKRPGRPVPCAPSGFWYCAWRERIRSGATDVYTANCSCWE